jgi:hypothetical protein
MKEVVELVGGLVEPQASTRLKRVDRPDVLE